MGYPIVKTSPAMPYIPEHFVERDPASLAAAIRAWPFAVLLSNGEDLPELSHLALVPVSKPGEPLTLFGHLARANGQLDTLFDGDRVRALFLGPHDYISPNDYVSPNMVPTWNYQAVYADGTLSRVDEPARLHARMVELADYFERGSANPWRYDAERQAGLLPHIVGFEIAVDSLVGKFKLSQNRSRADRDSVIARLASGDDNQRALAAAMQAALEQE